MVGLIALYACACACADFCIDRGEAANHGLLDAFHLVSAIERMVKGEIPQKEALDGYEKELRERTRRAVLLSRQACYDAHSWEDLNENCAVLSKRAIIK